MSKRWMPPEEWKALQEEREQERAEISARILTRIEITEAWPDKWEIAFPDLYSSITSFIEKALSDVLDTVGDYVFNPLVEQIKSIWTAIYNKAKEGFDLVEDLIAGLGPPWKEIARIFLMPFAFAYTLLKPVIEGVTNALKPVIDGIAITLEGVGAAVYNALPQPLKDFIGWLGELGKALWTGLNDFIKDPVGTLQTGWNFVAGKVGEIGAGIEDAFAGAYEWLRTNVGDPILNGIGQIGGWVADALKGVAEALGGALSGFLDWIVKHLMWLGEMICGAIGAVRAAVAPIVGPFLTEIIDTATKGLIPGSPPEEVEQATAAFSAQLLKRLSEIPPPHHSPVPSLTELLAASAGVVGMGMLTSFGMSSIATYLDMVHPARMTGIMHTANNLLYSLNFPAMIGPIIFSNIWAGIILPLRHRWNEVYKPSIPEASHLARFRAKGLMDGALYTQNMAFQGFGGEFAAMYEQDVARIPTVMELNQMVWREKISLEAFRGALRVTGVREDFILGYEELTKAIPPWRDLVTMAVREVFPPEDFYVYMPLHGFSRVWAERYWEMHWILLPLGEVRRARHRDVINDDETAKYLVLHDYKPEPRPGIRISDQEIASKLVWDLPGRIEARWMFRWGIRDRDGLKELLIKGGLDPEYADEAADAVATNQFLREIRMQETNIKADLRDGYIDEATARADFAEIGYPLLFIEYHIADALKDRERSHKKELLTYYKDCFLKDIATVPPFEDAVREILVVEEAADLFIQRTYIRKVGKLKVAA